MSVRMNVRLPDKLYSDLKVYAESEGVSITDVVIAE